MAGTLDTSFGTNGGWTDTIIIDGLSSQGVSLKLDTSGRIIVTGFLDYGNNIYKIFVARYTNNGILDTSFGENNGWTIFTVDQTATCRSLVLDNNDRIVVTGRIGDTDIQRLLVVRFTRDGLLDTSFGENNGWTATTFINGQISIGTSLVLDRSDRILITGLLDYGNNIYKILLVRYTRDGLLDTSFGENNGWTATTFIEGVSSIGASLVLDRSDRILVTGRLTDTDINRLLLLVRYTRDGILDTTFGENNGWTATTFIEGVSSIGVSLVLDKSDRILVTGSLTGTDINRLLLVRYTRDGILDTTFGENNGWTATTFIEGVSSNTVSLVLDSSDRIVVNSIIFDILKGGLLLTRYTNSGILDISFGNNGFTIFNKGVANDVVIDNGGRIICIGGTGAIVNQLGLLTLSVFRFNGGDNEPICLPAGTPILTDQGHISIELINPKKHTIGNKRIIAITTTITPEKNLVVFEANSIGINCPSRRTIMTPGHEVFYKGKLVQAKHFLGRMDGVHTIPYNGKTLYNVLQEKHGLMNVNNMILETLHPENKVAKQILKK